MHNIWQVPSIIIMSIFEFCCIKGTKDDCMFLLVNERSVLLCLLSLVFLRLLCWLFFAMEVNSMLVFLSNPTKLLMQSKRVGIYG